MGSQYQRTMRISFLLFFSMNVIIISTKPLEYNKEEMDSGNSEIEGSKDLGMLVPLGVKEAKKKGVKKGKLEKSSEEKDSSKEEEKKSDKEDKKKSVKKEEKDSDKEEEK